MPTYDYYCQSNNRTVEVRHRMAETLASWGELCERANVDPGDTPVTTPVRRVISGGHYLSGASAGGDAAPAPAPSMGGGCCGGHCGCG